MSQTSDFLVGHTIMDIKIMNQELFIYLDNGGVYSVASYLADDGLGPSHGLNFQIIFQPTNK